MHKLRTQLTREPAGAGGVGWGVPGFWSSVLGGSDDQGVSGSRPDGGNEPGLQRGVIFDPGP